MKDKQVVVIGGNGQLGQAAVQGAIGLGAAVTILSRQAKAPNTKAKAVQGSITDLETLRTTLADADAVIISVEADQTATGLSAVYVGGMKNVIAATPMKTHIVFMGNIGVTNLESMPEYNRAKLEAEALLRQSGKTYTIIRPSWIVRDQTGAKLEQGDRYTGRRDDLSHDQLAEAIAAILANSQAAAGKTFELYGSKQPITDWKSVLNDLARDE